MGLVHSIDFWRVSGPEGPVWSQDLHNGIIRRWAWLEEVDTGSCLTNIYLILPQPSLSPGLSLDHYICEPLLPVSLMGTSAPLWPRKDMADPTWAETWETMEQESIFLLWTSSSKVRYVSHPTESLMFSPQARIHVQYKQSHSVNRGSKLIMFFENSVGKFIK